MPDANLKLARKIKKFLDGHEVAHEATVREIAEAVGAPVEEVVEVIESHVVNEDGKLAHVGAGRGGGWAPPPEPEEAEGDEPAA